MRKCLLNLHDGQSGATPFCKNNSECIEVYEKMTLLDLCMTPLDVLLQYTL